MTKPKRKLSKPKRESHLVPLKTDDELREFIHDWCSGHVTSTYDLRPEMVTKIFLPIFLGAFGGWTKTELKNIGLIYAVAGRDRTMGGVALNGVSMFATCRIMHKDDWARARIAINAELDRRKNIEV